jgi:hypothetical protein
MQKENFEKLIQLVTGREFYIKTEDKDLEFEKEYKVYRVLPATQSTAYFYWKTPKVEDKMLRSFITAFTSKYREPNPASYDYTYGGKQYFWAEKTEEQKEHCFLHHASHMYSKEALLKQVEENFNNPSISSGLLRYGFYETNYGIGIFCFWMTTGVHSAIDAMKQHLIKLSIPFTNEFSDARWVYRFKIGISKETHISIINQLKA